LHDLTLFLLFYGVRLSELSYLASAAFQAVLHQDFNGVIWAMGYVGAYAPISRIRIDAKLLFFAMIQIYTQSRESCNKKTPGHGVRVFFVKTDFIPRRFLFPCWHSCR
jgi:hypothetical protein